MSNTNYYRYSYDYNQSLGQDLEDELRQASLEVFGKSYKRATRDEDLYKGTDCFVYGRPIDFTYAAIKKNKTIWFKRTYNADGITFKFGIRFGNSSTRNFKVPVLVIAVDVYDDAQMRMMLNKIVSSYKKHAEKIVNLGGYQYATWLSNHPDWKEGPKYKKHANRPRVTSISYC